MFGWLKRGRSDLFSPRQRLIYRYFDGKREVAADPLTLYKRIMAVGPEMDADNKVARSASKDNVKAHEKLLAKIRSIFDLATLDQGGLTEIETVALLDHFLTFCDELKKNIKPPATSPAETSPPIGIWSVGVPPTPNGSASGSTASGPSTALPPPSPTEPASPSDCSTPEASISIQ